MLGVFIRMAQLKSKAGSRDPVVKTAIVTQAVTALEQFLRLVLEERLDAEGGAGSRVVRIRGIKGPVRVSVSRLVASGRGYQSVRKMCELADGHGCRPWQGACAG